MANTGDVLVVGADGSAASDRALEWALQEARRRGAEVQVITTYGPVQHAGALAETSRARHAREAAEKSQAEQLTRVAEPYRRDVAVTPEVVDGHPAERLVEASREASLLVLGSHGAGAVHQALVGSVTAACVKAAYCPVVVLPPTQRVPEEEEPQQVPRQYLPGLTY